MKLPRKEKFLCEKIPGKNKRGLKISPHVGDSFLLCTGYLSDTEILTDRSSIGEVLRHLPTIIGMKSIGNLLISEAQNNPGLEGYIPMDDSNITISTYTNNSRFVVCIHSCKDFDCGRVIDYLKDRFHCGNIKFLYLHESDFLRVK